MEYSEFQNQRGQEQIECLDAYYENNSDFVEEEMKEIYGS